MTEGAPASPAKPGCWSTPQGPGRARSPAVQPADWRAGRRSGSGNPHRAAPQGSARHLLCREPERRSRGIRDALAGRHVDRHHGNALPRQPGSGAAAARGGGVSACRGAATISRPFRAMTRRRHRAALCRLAGVCRPPRKRPLTDRGRRFLPPTVTHGHACRASTAANSPVGGRRPRRCWSGSRPSLGAERAEDGPQRISCRLRRARPSMKARASPRCGLGVPRGLRACGRRLLESDR